MNDEILGEGKEVVEIADVAEKIGVAQGALQVLKMRLETQQAEEVLEVLDVLEAAQNDLVVMAEQMGTLVSSFEDILNANRILEETVQILLLASGISELEASKPPSPFA